MTKVRIVRLVTLPVVWLRASRQRLILKSNARCDLKTTLNFGEEVRCDDAFTLDCSLSPNSGNFCEWLGISMDVLREQ